MTSLFRRFFATIAATFAIALPASATTYSIDYTDLWYAGQSEAGYGLNVVQQYNTIFATLYVYGPDSQPRWYFASGMTGSANSYTGQLYRTTGPVVTSNPFPGFSSITPVGTMTLNFNSAITGTLTYSVDGATVTKQIARNTFAGNVLTGRFLGGMTANASSCTNSQNNGPALIFGDLIVTQTGNSVAMRVDFFNGAGLPSTCNFTGTFAPQGRFGTISNGTMSCTQGSQSVNQGSFTMTQIDSGINGMSSVFTGGDQFCQYNGRFGGLKDVLP